MATEMVVYQGEERRKMPSISQEQLDELIEKAAEKAAIAVTKTLQESNEQVAELAALKAAEMLKDDAYKTVGKAVMDKAAWAIGVLVLAALYVANVKGWIK